MKKLQLKLSVLCSCLAAMLPLRRNAVALANEEDPQLTPAQKKAKEKEDAEALLEATSGNDAELELMQRDEDEAAIRKMIECGLERPQAEAALRHKKEFTRRDRELMERQKKGAKK